MRLQVRTMLLALGVLLAATPSFAVMCGEVITDAQTLTADLNCMTDPAVTIGAGGSLDMDGFKISCAVMAEGVLLNGLGAKLSNGVISGCAYSGVRASGGKHKIERVLVSSCGTGFSIVSIGNKVSNCAALNNTSQGFYVPAPENSLSHLIAKNNGGAGLEAGAHNKITDVSIAVNSAVTGMQVVGEGSKISKVRISDASIGFYLSGTLNKVSEVTSLKHTTTGFQIYGNDNQVKKSVASTTAGSSGAGFSLGAGSNNSISGCRSTGSTKGIIIMGGGNLVSKNKVFGAGDNGIELLGSNNSATGNFAVGSGTFDLFENISGCANGDVWEKNVGTRNDSCIE